MQRDYPSRAQENKKDVIVTMSWGHSQQKCNVQTARNHFSLCVFSFYRVRSSLLSVSVIDAKRAALRQSSPRRASPPRPPSRRPTTSTSGGKLENLAKQGEQTLAAVRGVKWRADGRGRAAPAPVALLYSAPASLLLHPGVVFFCSLISFLV